MSSQSPTLRHARLGLCSLGYSLSGNETWESEAGLRLSLNNGREPSPVYGGDFNSQITIVYVQSSQDNCKRQFFPAKFCLSNFPRSDARLCRKEGYEDEPCGLTNLKVVLTQCNQLDESSHQIVLYRSEPSLQPAIASEVTVGSCRPLFQRSQLEASATKPSPSDREVVKWNHPVGKDLERIAAFAGNENRITSGRLRTELSR